MEIRKAKMEKRKSKIEKADGRLRYSYLRSTMARKAKHEG
jgi:hypothetical protein